MLRRDRRTALTVCSAPIPYGVGYGCVMCPIRLHPSSPSGRCYPPAGFAFRSFGPTEVLNDTFGTQQKICRAIYFCNFCVIAAPFLRLTL